MKFTEASLSADVPTGSLEYLRISFIFLISGVVLYCISSILFGRKREAGKRAILFVFGGIAGAAGVSLLAYSYHDFIEQDYPRAIGGPVAILLFIFSIWCIGVSLFGSNECVRYIFNELIGER